MGVTTDPNDEGLRKTKDDEQQEVYLVLSDEERAKGFVRPVRRSYKHLACGSVTTMDDAIAQTYARNPKFYGWTFCFHCRKHFRLFTWLGRANFVWPHGSPVGS